MSNFVSELFSIIITVFRKCVFFAFPLLFVASLLFKMNWAHHSSFIMTIIILLFSTSSVYGIYTYLIFYFVIRGLTGHYVPRCLPPFPYFMTGPQIDQINYYKESTMPQIFESYEEYKSNNQEGTINGVIRWFFPYNAWHDKDCLQSKVYSSILDIENDDWDNKCGSYVLTYDLYRAKD